MPPKPLVDLDDIDLGKIEDGPEGIRECNPQRYEFEQLDGIIFFNPDEKVVVGFKDVTDDEFWVRGHIPDRPLLPGVLMCEAAAQLCTYYYKKAMETEKFLGFGALNNVKFRGQVEPGERLILVAKNTDLRSRRAVFDCQGFVDDKLIFEGEVTGMPM
ncbi:MAG: 3-hydroxyacyl-ACP dehydratase FabZ family protein [Candidatus Brocadiia bacterium]